MTTGGLSCAELRVEIAGRILVDHLELSVEAGSLLGILGRNGSGKTTTLHTLAGLRQGADAGIMLDGRPISSWPRREVARRLGLVTQHLDNPFPISVLETVVAGRHPHLDFWRWESEADRDRARDALAIVGLDDLADRAIETLSGGERRRVAIATLLCQSPRVCLLDEPTNHLDPAHEQAVMALLKDLADSGHGVAASLHDVNAASRYCDRCLLLFGDGEWSAGPTDEILTVCALERLYGVSMREARLGGERVFYVP
jgi:iron complex transport system ATP-binding protein